MNFINNIVEWAIQRRTVMIVSAIVAVLILTVFRICSGAETPQPDPAAVASTPATVTPSFAPSAMPTVTTPQPTRGPDADPVQDSEPMAKTAAVSFVKAWLMGRYMPRASWQDLMFGCARPGLREALKATDPKNLPNTDINGQADVLSMGVGIADIRVGLEDGTSVDVWVTYDKLSGWMAENVLPVDQ